MFGKPKNGSAEDRERANRAMHFDMGKLPRRTVTPSQFREAAQADRWSERSIEMFVRPMKGGRLHDQYVKVGGEMLRLCQPPPEVPAADAPTPA